ncbi:MAG TPA: hypothetical protein VN850_06695 [Candidatus Acidoferrales bacterium]|jgi:hypothetical protein|nr:hypothetical protein [Candidatus Acidoferrales bacterium]
MPTVPRLDAQTGSRMVTIKNFRLSYHETKEIAREVAIIGVNGERSQTKRLAALEQG